MEDRTLALTVGQNMASRRRARGLTQAQAAEKLSISQESLSRMEKGQISPKFSRLRGIAQVLGCSVPELFLAPAETTADRVRTLMELLRTLPPHKQDAVVAALAEIIHAMRDD